MLRVRDVACIIFALAAVPSAAAAATYVVFSIPSATAPSTQTMINNPGDVAGTYAVSDPSAQLGFVRLADGSVTQFSAFGALNLQVSGIDYAGSVVGTATDALGQTHCFVKHNGEPARNLLTIKTESCQTTTMNDNGVVVGNLLTEQGVSSYFRQSGAGAATLFTISSNLADPRIVAVNAAGAMTGWTDEGEDGFLLQADGSSVTFQIAGATNGTYPTSINASGSITGFDYIVLSESSVTKHGFLRTPDGTITTFDPPGSAMTVPLSINKSGAIVGYYSPSSFFETQYFTGFLRLPDGRFLKINPPGALISQCSAINDRGEIVGEFFDVNGWHYFLRMP
jgi:hypothetical protein